MKKNIRNKIKRISVLRKNGTTMFAKRRNICMKRYPFLYFTMKGFQIRDTVQNNWVKIAKNLDFVEIVILSEKI